jgi:hypothetical protein
MQLLDGSDVRLGLFGNAANRNANEHRADHFTTDKNIVGFIKHADNVDCFQFTDYKFVFFQHPDNGDSVEFTDQFTDHCFERDW